MMSEDRFEVKILQCTDDALEVSGGGISLLKHK